MSKTQTITIILPWPNKALSPNARSGNHWARTRAVKKARNDANWATIAAMRVCKWITVDRAETQVTFVHNVNRKRDGDNFLSCLKSAFDGMADAGLIANDVGFRHLPAVFRIEKNSKPHVVVEIRELASK